MKTQTTHGDDMFKVGGIKLSLDGGVVTKTGFFYEHYPREPENFGRTKWEREKLHEAIKIFHDAGWQTCTHTIGDQAIDRVKKLGVMANVQSTFIHFEGDVYVRNLWGAGPSASNP